MQSTFQKSIPHEVGKDHLTWGEIIKSVVTKHAFL